MNTEATLWLVNHHTLVPCFDILTLLQLHSWNQHFDGGKMVVLVPKVKTEGVLGCPSIHVNEGYWDLHSYTGFMKRYGEYKEDTLVRVCLKYPIKLDENFNGWGQYADEAARQQKLVCETVVQVWNDLVDLNINPFNINATRIPM